MKFIARYLNLIGLLLLASFVSAAAALYFHVPERIQAAQSNASAAPAGHSVAGCCAEKPVAAVPPPAANCPHLAAQAAKPAQTPPADSCCPKPAKS